jgi:hypothetical protein
MWVRVPELVLRLVALAAGVWADMVLGQDVAELHLVVDQGRGEDAGVVRAIGPDADPYQHGEDQSANEEQSERRHYRVLHERRSEEGALCPLRSESQKCREGQEFWPLST